MPSLPIRRQQSHQRNGGKMKNRGQQSCYDFVGNHAERCMSVFDADYFRFDSEHCKSCRAEVERRKNAQAANPLLPGEEILLGLKL